MLFPHYSRFDPKTELSVKTVAGVKKLTSSIQTVKLKMSFLNLYDSLQEINCSADVSQSLVYGKIKSCSQVFFSVICGEYKMI